LAPNNALVQRQKWALLTQTDSIDLTLLHSYFKPLNLLVDPSQVTMQHSSTRLEVQLITTQELTFKDSKVFRERQEQQVLGSSKTLNSIAMKTSKTALQNY
jgi:hypothetical protein